MKTTKTVLETFRLLREDLEQAFHKFVIEPSIDNGKNLASEMFKYEPAFKTAIDEGIILIDDKEIVDVDPNQNKYTCAPYGVPKCPRCLQPTDECIC